MSIQDLTAKLAQRFVETKSFKYDPENQFKLSSGKLSTYYVDCKTLMAYAKNRELIGELAFEKIKNLEIDCIGGMEIGAIHIASAISDHRYRLTPEREWPTFTVRKRPKEHGLEKAIEGYVEFGARALVVDDVLTTGGSVVDAVKAARHAKMFIDHALVIVDRQEYDGRQNFEELKINLHSLLTIKDLLSEMKPDFAVR